ncbi:MAG: aminopeptidase P family protein [Lachnospiraceae bacterium]|nr:aminopeptidase P family protein [Lachnospiraceae bacterium]
MYNELISKRLEDLRNRMKLENIDYYLFVTADFHSSEYVSGYFKAREYFSGFNGSNGDLLVWKDGAALWTDGRYFLQASQQLEGTGIELMKMGMKDVPTVEEFLEKRMLPDEKLGVDGRCIPLGRGKELEEVCRRVSSKACKDAENPENSGVVLIDLAENTWVGRPALPENKAWLLKKADTGESRAERISRVRGEMKKKNADVLVLSSLDDIAWLLLLRGADIDYNPVVLSYAVVLENRINLYINKKTLDESITKELEADGVVIKDYNAIYGDVKDVQGLIRESGGNVKDEPLVMLDPKKVSYSLYMAVCENGVSGESSGKAGGVRLLEEACPITIMKACKTPEEIEFERKAHLKDGVAVTKLLYHLHRLRESRDFKTGEKTVTELKVAERLLELRKSMNGFLDQSFAPIIATAEHGAIIHYEPDEESNAAIKSDAFLLMDTGGQYTEGTTDITRTVMMGVPSLRERKLYTAVLCGNLRLAAAVFPEGTTGQNLDILARGELWNSGLDYRHGTGHGVGFLLNVHEGPQNINLKGTGGKLTAAFREGMITSDEPGVYIDGELGIRLENMMVCLPVEKLVNEKDEPVFDGEASGYAKDYGPFYGFETLTMVPFDRRCILPSMMTERDKALLNAYHKKVFEKISPYLDDNERAWLREETREI